MYFFPKILSLFKMTSLLPPPDPIPAALRPGPQARRPLSAWYAEFINLSREDHNTLAAFTLTSIFHWEHMGNLKHEGLTFVFERDPLSIVYLRVDRMSIENDPWTSADYQARSKSISPSPKPSNDQDSPESLSRAVDWCQPLNNDGVLKYFTRPNTDSEASSARSLGNTHFRTTRPNVINVILAMYAVSKLRPNCNVWRANCWWLARSIRLFIEREWNGEADFPIPRGRLVDRRGQQLLQDQDGIREIYADFNKILLTNLDLHRAHERVDEEVEGCQVEAEGRRVEAEGRRVEAEARLVAESRAHEAEDRARAAEDRAHAAQTYIAELEERLRQQSLK